MHRGGGGPFGVAAITGGTGVPIILGVGGIPLIGLSSGSVSAVGAISGITALPAAYAQAYCYFPANILATVKAAGWYYCTFSTTTAGTAFLDTYTSGTPTAPSSPTAVTDGKGAFTGDTGAEVAYTVAVPAGAMGINGGLKSYVLTSATNSVGTKLATIKYGSTGVGTALGNITTQLNQEILSTLANQGGASRQVGRSFQITNGAAVTTANYPAENSATALNWTVTIQRNTATDNYVLETFSLELAAPN